MGTRRRYNREFKVEAVRLVVARRVAVTQAARELNVHANVLRNWVRAYRADPKQAFPGVGQQAPEAVGRWPCQECCLELIRGLRGCGRLDGSDSRRG
jgi:transposase-like protein